MSEMPSAFDEAFDSTQAILDQPVEAPVEELPSLEEETLLQRGYFSATVTLGTNKVIIRTLKIGEELEVALVAKKYQDTIEATRALIAATVAASIVSVNGQSLIPFALGTSDASIEAKFIFIGENWYWNTVRVLYEEYNKLVEKQLEVAESVKKN